MAGAGLVEPNQIEGQRNEITSLRKLLLRPPRRVDFEENRTMQPRTRPSGIPCKTSSNVLALYRLLLRPGTLEEAF